DGDHWQALKNGLPDTPVHDVWVEANDVAIATHGRGFYILDDVQPLRQFAAAPRTSGVYFFKPGDAGRNADPAKLTYLLTKQPQKLTLEMLDSSGAVIRSFEGALPQAGRGRAGGPGASGRSDAGQAGRAGQAGQAGQGGRAGQPASTTSADAEQPPP